MFRDFEVGAAFHYLRSFRRIRVDFESPLSASNAKQHIDSTIIGENTIHCYFIQVSGVLGLFNIDAGNFLDNVIFRWEL